MRQHGPVHCVDCVQDCTWTLREWHAAARAVAGAPSNCPVEVVPWATPPHVNGYSIGYTTRTGMRIWYPSAYRKRGWVYVRSTRRVVVGGGWRP